MSDGREERKEKEERRKWEEERKDPRRDPQDRQRDWEREGGPERRDSRAVADLTPRWFPGGRGAASGCRERSTTTTGARQPAQSWRDTWPGRRARPAARRKSGGWWPRVVRCEA